MSDIRVVGPAGTHCPVRGCPVIEERQGGKWEAVPLSDSTFPAGAEHRLPLQTVHLGDHRYGFLILSFAMPTCFVKSDRARIHLPGLRGWMPIRRWGGARCRVADGASSPVIARSPLPPPVGSSGSRSHQPGHGLVDLGHGHR